MSQLHDALVSHRPRFISFVRSRVPDRAAAEDIVQAAFARVLERGGVPDDGEAAIRWFYRVLRNAAVDDQRRRASEARSLERFQRDPATQPAPARGRLCRCVQRALAELKPHYQHIVRRVEVERMPLDRVAAETGITRNNAAVRLHRARRLLGERLRGICGSCSLDGCADCDCQAS